MPKKSKRSKSESKSNNQKDGYTLSLNEEEPPISTSHSKAATSEKMEQISNFTEYKKAMLKKVTEGANQDINKVIEDNNLKVVLPKLNMKPAIEEPRKETTKKPLFSKSWAFNMSGQPWSESPLMKKILPSNRPPAAPLESLSVQLLPREDFLLSGEIPKIDNKILAQCVKCECVISPSDTKTHINDPEHCQLSSLNLATLKDLNSTKKNSKQRKSKKSATPKALPPVPLFLEKLAPAGGSGSISMKELTINTLNLNEQNSKEKEKLTFDSSNLLTKKLAEPISKQDCDKFERLSFNTLFDSPVLEKVSEVLLDTDMLQNIVITPKRKAQKSKCRRSKNEKKLLVESESNLPYTDKKIKEEVDSDSIIEILLEAPTETSPHPLMEPEEVIVKIEENIEDIDISPICEKVIPINTSKSPYIPQPKEEIIENTQITFETFSHSEKPKQSSMQLKAKVTFMPVNPPPTCYSSITPQPKVPNIQQNYNTIYSSHPKPILNVSMRAIKKFGSTYLLQNQHLEHQKEEIRSLLNKKHNIALNSNINAIHHRPNILKNSARANIGRLNAKRISTDKLTESSKRLRPNNDINTFILHTDISDSIDNMVNSHPKELPNSFTVGSTDYFR